MAVCAGAFRYRCNQSPIWTSNCHCKACQVLSGGPYTSAFTVRTDGFEVLSGQALKFERAAESGQAVRTVRCKGCGTWVYAERDSHPEWRSVLATTLDDVSKFVVISNVYVCEAAPWSILDPALMQFQKMPEDELRG
ncbi:MAG: GFA family protein [Burkholderiales bacterium]